MKRAVFKSKNGKSPGVDQLPYEIFKNDYAIQFLHTLFCKCFDTGNIPSLWLKSIINPIPKNNTTDPRDPLKYRGISLACSVYKIYCGILNARLSTWAEENDVLHDSQNGFRKSRSCIDHISSLYNILDTRRKLKQSTYVLFVDFAKAFDSLDRNLLWNKLANMIGLGKGKFMNSLYSLYSNVQACVKVNDRYTNWFQVSCGLKQGCILSPLLFSMYINDLASDLEQLNMGIRIGGQQVAIMMYADDIVLLSSSPEGLQHMADRLYSWCSTWKLQVNLDKTKIMHVRPGPKSNRTSFLFKYGQQDISITDKYVYLGMLFTELLDMQQTCKSISQSANRALGLLIAKSKAIGGMPFETFSKLYDSLVQPIIDYSAGIWGTNSVPFIGSVQRRAERYFLGVGRYTPNAALHGELGWKSPEHRQWLSVFRLFLRLKNMDKSRINSLVFDWSIRCTRAGIKNWGFKIKSFLHKLGMSHLWYSDDEIDSKHVLNDLDHLLLEYYATEWYDLVASENSKSGKGGNKLSLYSKFKKDVSTEFYVQCIMDKGERSALAKFRCGVAPLQVEVGRYLGIKKDMRICALCNLNELEDEGHALLRCSLHTDLRDDLFRYCDSIIDFNELSEIDKLCFILSDPAIVLYTARVCKSILTRRKSFLSK